MTWKNTETRREFMEQQRYNEHHRKELARVARVWACILLAVLGAVYLY